MPERGPGSGQPDAQFGFKQEGLFPIESPPEIKVESAPEEPVTDEQPEVAATETVDHSVVPVESASSLSGPERVRLRAQEIEDRVARYAADINGGVSAAREDETGSLFTPDSSAAGKAALERIDETAHQARLAERHAREDVDLAKQQAIDTAGRPPRMPSSTERMLSEVMARGAVARGETVPQQAVAPEQESHPSFEDAEAAVEAARIRLAALRSGDGSAAEVVGAKADLARLAREAIRLGQDERGLSSLELMDRRRKLIIKYGDDAGLARKP